MDILLLNKSVSPLLKRSKPRPYHLRWSKICQFTTAASKLTSITKQQTKKVATCQFQPNFNFIYLSRKDA